jgi:hypothetical protein
MAFRIRDLSPLLSALILLGTCEGLFAEPPPLQCVAQSFPRQIRMGGGTELLEDIVVHCTGGTPTPAGVPVPKMDLSVALNVPLASRLTQGTWSEALLIIDQPHSAMSPGRPILACAYGASPYTSSCEIPGSADPSLTYDGSSGRPNVFQGFASGSNMVTFPAVPLDPPGVLGSRTLRITNLRADLTASLPGPTTGVIAHIESSPPSMLPLTPNSVTAGNAVAGLGTVTGNTVQLSACSGANTAIAVDPQQSLGTGAADGTQFRVTIREGFVGAFRFKGIAQMVSNAGGGSIPVYPPDQNQNVPGAAYYGETGFYNGSDTDGVQFPDVSQSQPFPTNNGLNRAGLADSGTRIALLFSGVPSGLRLFVPVTIRLTSTDTGARPGLAVLVNADASGGGAYERIVGNSAGLAEISAARPAVYELVYADPVSIEVLTVPVAAAYVVNGSNGLAAGTVSVTVALAPMISVVGASETAWIPRFTTTLSSAQAAFEVLSCNPPDLTIAASQSGTPPAGSTAVSVAATVTNSGSGPTSGVVTLVATLGSGVTASGISGAGWTCNAGTFTCMRSDALAASSSYPPVAITASIPDFATSTPEIYVIVSGGGEVAAGNNSAAVTLALADWRSVTISTLPAGLAFSVEGTAYTNLQRFNWQVGSSHAVTTGAAQLLGGTPYVFVSWSNGGARTQNFTAGQTTDLIANFTVGQSATCTFSPSLAHTLRNQGITEAVGDALISCTGGTPTPPGMAVPKIDLAISLNTNITSRITSAGMSEALLIIDEPHTSANPHIPLLVCGGTGSNATPDGTCSITGTATPSATYDGSTGRPNVFQGRPEGANKIVFPGVPFDPPGAGIRTLRITNIRANTSQLGVSATLVPTQIVANIDGLAFNNPQQTLAFVTHGLGHPVFTDTAWFRQCQTANPSIAGDMSKPLDTGNENGLQFTIRLTEGFPQAWKEKNIEWHLLNRPSPSTGVFPPVTAASDAAQDVPGQNLFSESGFLANGVTPSYIAGPVGYGPFLPAGAAFPSVTNLHRAGAADSGTRLYLRFTGVPSGVKLFLPVQVELRKGTNRSGTAVLVRTDAWGSGTFSRVTGNTFGLAPVEVIGSAATAVYEVILADPFGTESVDIPVALAYLAGAPLPGEIWISAGYGPISVTMTAGDFSVPFPRFAESLTSRLAFQIEACLPDYSISVSRTGVFARGDVGRSYSVTVQNVGAASGSGRVDVVVNASGGLTPKAITGAGWSCTLETLTCTRSDAVGGGATFPTITLTVDVSPDAPSAVTVSATVSSAADAAPGNNTASDTTTLLAAGARKVPGDFDGDGVPDLVWQNDTTRTVGVWHLSGPAATTRHRISYPAPGNYPGWTLVTVADMDNNGVPDLVWQNDATRAVGTWYMSGADGSEVTGIEMQAPDSYPGWKLVAVADMDRNGVPDLIWQHDSTRNVGTWYMGGAKALTLLSVDYQAPGEYPGWRVVAAADMDGNGVPDLVWQHDATRQVGTWYLNGAKATTLLRVEFQAPGAYPGWKIVSVVDMDRDGVHDLVWQHDTTREVGTWYMGGTNTTVLRNIEFQAAGEYPGWRAVGAR